MAHISPPTLQRSVQTSRGFCSRHNALPLYDHCHDVLKTAASVGIVEGRIIKDPKKDQMRRWANSILAETILYHVLEHSGISSAKNLPLALLDERVMEELAIFCKLTALERSGADLSEFVPILSGGRAPLALLAKIADYAVTHDSADIQKVVGPWDAPLFRVYTSKEDLRE